MKASFGEHLKQSVTGRIQLSEIFTIKSKYTHEIKPEKEGKYLENKAVKS